MSSEQTINPDKRTDKTRKRKKINQNKDKNNDKAKEEKQSQKRKLPPPIIYDPNNTQENSRLADDNNIFKNDQERITREAKEITNYYLEFHKNMINTYNSLYSRMLQNSSGLS